MKKDEDIIKEPFCGACLAVPLAIAGAGTAGAGSSKKNKKLRTWLVWGGVIVSVISIIVAIYFITLCQECAQQ